jgi:branched-chain amino acid transport system permease protein
MVPATLGLHEPREEVFMLQYVIAGLVLGGIYAIAAAGLVITYVSTGILNFSFGALAYFVARCYYFLNTQHHWPILSSAAVSIVGVGPGLGALLYLLLFRRLRLSSSLVKIVTTLGLLVVLPAAASVIFGDQTILLAPGLAPQPVHVFRFVGVPVTLDQLIDYGCVAAVVLLGAAILRYTDVGLRVRAMVDSPAMTSLSGTNPNLVAVGVWATSCGLAGLAGVLTAPIVGLDSGDYTLLMVAAFTAVITAKLRNLPLAVMVGLALGVVEAMLQYVLPSGSPLTADVLPSVPFAVTAVVLVTFVLRGREIDEAKGVGGAIDRAASPRGSLHVWASTTRRRVDDRWAWRPALAASVAVALLPIALSGVWLSLLGQGVAYGIIFLSIILVTGEGGMIWLCQVTFAGVGALTTAQLADRHGWPVLAALLVGGLVALGLGLVIGALTIRLGDLYVALVTLTFGLLIEFLVFSQNLFVNDDRGVSVPSPQFASGPRALAWLELAVFAMFALVIINLRRSTTGLALNATRASESAARTVGISVWLVKVLVAGLSAFIAGVGGAMLAIAFANATPTTFSTLGGVFWLAVLVTLGIRSIMASLVAGLVFTLLAEFAFVYLPPGYGSLLPLLFGLGATRVARYPDGWLAMQARVVRSLVGRLPLPAKAPLEAGPAQR